MINSELAFINSDPRYIAHRTLTKHLGDLVIPIERAHIFGINESARSPRYDAIAIKFDKYGDFEKAGTAFNIDLPVQWNYVESATEAKLSDGKLTITKMKEGQGRNITILDTYTLDAVHDPLPPFVFKPKESERKMTKEQAKKKLEKAINNLPIETSVEYRDRGEAQKRNAFFSAMAELGAAYVMNEKALPGTYVITTDLRTDLPKTTEVELNGQYGPYTKKIDTKVHLQWRGYDISTHPCYQKYKTIKAGTLDTLSHADVKFCPSESDPQYRTVPVEAYYQNPDGSLVKKGCWLWNEESTTIIYLLGSHYYSVQTERLRRFVLDNPPIPANTGYDRLWKTSSNYNTGYNNGKLSCYIPTSVFIAMADEPDAIPHPMLNRLEQTLETMAKAGSMWPLIQYRDQYEASWALVAFQANDSICKFIGKLPLRPRMGINKGAVAASILEAAKNKK